MFSYWLVFNTFWCWICIEPIHSSVLGIYILNETNMIDAEKFIRSRIQIAYTYSLY